MSQDTLDIDALTPWIGREERRTDVATGRLAMGLASTLDLAANFPGRNGLMPVLLHFCLMPPTEPMSQMDVDGHPHRGGFLPPVPLPRRMWAASRVNFLHPLTQDEMVTRISRIADVSLKTGRSGTLVFVEVDHVYTGSGGAHIEDRQSIVYREASAGDVAPPPPVTAQGQHRRALFADPVLLLRYSALTFNAHRIHYDLPYAMNEEGYPGLVVHGPLQASLLAEFSAELRGQPPRSFSFRGLTPLIAGQAFTLNAQEGESGLSLWVLNAQGHKTMEAQAQW